MPVILNIDMPYSCEECELARVVAKDKYACQVTLKAINSYRKRFKKHPKCPLRECK